LIDDIGGFTRLHKIKTRRETGTVSKVLNQLQLQVMALSVDPSLSRLLATLKPVLSGPTFVFATFRPNEVIPRSLPIQMIFHEAKGTTVITSRAAADVENLDYQSPCRMLTLDVDSSLEVVGFVPFVAKRLEDLDMSVNSVSGYYHNHCFVPLGREEEAIKCVEEIARQAQEGKEEQHLLD
jgi:hypothetical protein